MKTLRKSRAAKITAFILALLFGALFTADIAFALVLYQNNLYSANERSFKNKMFSRLAESTINEVINYFDCRQSYLSASNDSRDYWESEMSLYKSKYASDSSNIFFTVSDDSGNVVLDNAPERGKTEYTFSRKFTRTVYTDSFGNSFVVTPNSSAFSDGVPTQPDITQRESREEENPDQENVSTMMPEEPEYDSETEYHDTTELTAKKTAPSESFLADKYSSPEASVKTESSGSYIMVEMWWTDDRSLDGKYLFSSQDGLNGQIYSFCSDDFIGRRQDGDITPMVYFQSDYTVSPSGYVVTAANDGSDVPEGLSAKNVQYTVTVNIPDELPESDIYRFVSRAVSFGVAYRNVLIPVSVIYLLLLIVCVVFVFCSAGFTATAEVPFAGGIHRIPFDIVTAIYLILGFLCVTATYEFLYDLSTNQTDYSIFAFATAYAFCVLSFLYLESLAVRIRSHTVFSNTLLSSFIRLIRKLMKTSGLLGKAVLIYLAELIIIALAVIFAATIDNIVIPAILGAIILFPLTLAGIYEFNVVLEGAKRFSNGDISTRIREKLLFGPFKSLANNLNSINDAVNNAVSARVKSESMKTELITNVSHDLKTPLTSIVNYIDLLKKLDIDDPNAKEYIEVIDRQSQRLKKLTVDIVEASKAATGNIELHPEKLDLCVMLSQMDGEYCDRLDQNALSLIINLPDTPTYVNVDGRLLWRVFDNIINNVCKYSLPGTRVYLSLSKENGVVTATLRNISKNELNIAPEELTERFVRGDSSRNTEGSGLGLSIASSLTELMGGKFKITIDGDLFKVSLSFPAAQ